MADLADSGNAHSVLDCDSPGFRETPPDLLQVIAGHARWLESEGIEGQQADLPGFDFQELDLAGCNFRRAILRGGRFAGANITRADFRGADLSDADLDRAENLLASQVGGADLTDARLPEEVRIFEELGNVAEASRLSSHTSLAILAACVYTWLTVATTTDAGLLTNSATSSLPIIQTPIPIVGFYLAAPALLLAVFIYFHISLQRLWERLANLPAVFPDGRRLDQVAYPWFLNGLVCSYMTPLKARRLPFKRMQVFICLLMGWIFVPLTLGLIWIRYLNRLDWPGTLWHICLFAGALWVGFRSYFDTRGTLAGKRSPGPFKLSAYLGAALFMGVLLFSAFFMRSVAANLSEQDVSTKPPNWTGKGHEEIGHVKGANLKGRDLRNVHAYRAFLVRANLNFANLQGADLRQADLYEANLQGADLTGADLSGADLQGANLASPSPTSILVPGATVLFKAKLIGANLKASNLRRVQLDKADLEGAEFFEANLESADFDHADFFKANLRKASLKGASFKGANLRQADLQETTGLNVEQLKEARNWPLASYDRKVSQSLNLPEEHNQRVKEKDLSNYDFSRLSLPGFTPNLFNLRRANFTGANLRGAVFFEADLASANLKDASLEGADLRHAKGLTREQIDSAMIDEKTQLPEDIKMPEPKKF